MNGPFDVALSVARELRRLPGLRAVYEKSDPARRARRLVRSGLIDTELYALQLCVDKVSAEQAAEHYVEWGYRAGLTINALLDDRALREGLPPTNRPPAYDYLWTKAWRNRVSPFWDVSRYIEEHPEALAHETGPVGHLWERAQADRALEMTLNEAHGSRRLTVERFVAEQGKSLAHWARGDSLRRARRLSPRFHGIASLGDWPSTTPQPLISIVLASWNRSGPLRESVESAREQTWTNWELLIVDDGSWDDTPTIGALLAERDPRIKYIALPHAGVSVARNAGIEAAIGEYITFLDSDNTWEPRFLENMLIAIRENRSPVAFATLEVDNGDHRLFREAEANPETLKLGNVIDLNTLVVHRDALAEIGGFDAALARAVDYDLILRLSAAFPIVHVPILGAIYQNEQGTVERISTSQPLGWNTFVRIKNSIDWASIAERNLLEGTSLVVIVHRDDPGFLDKLQAVRQVAFEPGITAHLALVAPSPSDWTQASAAAAEHPHIEAHMFAEAEPFSYVVSMMLAEADREGFAVVEPSTHFTPEALLQLARSVLPDRRQIVAPLLQHDDGTVVTVGAAFPKRSAAPVDMLSRHPAEDAEALGPAIAVPALSGRTFAVPTRDLVAIQGLDPLLYNEYELPAACLALRDRFGAYEVTTRTDVRMRKITLVSDFERIDQAGSLTAIRGLTRNITPTDLDAQYLPLDLTVSHFRSVATHPQASAAVPALRHLHPVVVRTRRMIDVDGVRVPRLRWALRIAAPAWPKGGPWGDTHFARSLARGLESWGQEVVIDHHEIGVRPTAYLDDVTLVLRGLDRVEPTTGGVSMLWVISHPDLVTRNEAAQYDHVFAASSKWARRAHERWGVDVEPLMQCTDPDVFFPRGDARRTDIVFVGKSRGVARPSVVYPVRAGVPVRVFGGEWDGILPDGTVEAEYIPNEQLGALYGSAGAVLNDHWNDMRRDGFIANRLFDVVASGGRAFTDRVEGIDEIFGNSVVQYDSPLELVEMLQGNIDAMFPTEPELASHAERMRAEHSFRARARQLLEVALSSLSMEPNK